jgi:hypothetical protein
MIRTNATVTRTDVAVHFSLLCKLPSCRTSPPPPNRVATCNISLSLAAWHGPESHCVLYSVILLGPPDPRLNPCSVATCHSRWLVRTANDNVDDDNHNKNKNLFRLVTCLTTAHEDNYGQTLNITDQDKII